MSLIMVSLYSTIIPLWFLCSVLLFKKYNFPIKSNKNLCFSYFYANILLMQNIIGMTNILGFFFVVPFVFKFCSTQLQ